MDTLVEVIFGILSLVVVPLVLTKTTERGRFDWVHPYLREIWTAIIALYLLLLAYMERDFLMAEKQRFNSLWHYLVVAVVFAAIGIFVWAATGWLLKKADQPKESEVISGFSPIEISLDCFPVELPITVPVGKTGYVFGLNESVRKTTNKVTLYQIPNGDGQFPKLWPEILRLEDAKRKYGPAEASAWRCEIRNGGNKTTVQVRLPYTILFAGKNSYEAILDVGSIPARDSFMLYFVNDCPVPVQFQLPHQGAGKLIDEPQVREFNPVSNQAWFSLQGNHSNWLGMACEPMATIAAPKELSLSAPRDWFREWKEQSAEFRQLANWGLRAHWQHSRATSSWSIQGGGGVANQKMETLCKLAGQMLMASPKLSRALPPEISEERNPRDRWLYYLRSRQSQFWRQELPAYEVHDDGHKEPIYFGTLQDVVTVSADQCLQCAAEEC